MYFEPKGGKLLKKVVIYTDGACSGNPGGGGWAALLMYGNITKEISGFEENTTNNRMELKACAEALKALKEPCEVQLYSDSAYLCNAFLKGWVYSWELNGWKTADKKEVKNIDLWQEILALVKIHSVTFVKVKGHAQNPHNNRCDHLAVQEIKKRAKDT
jgi:ribonuclease HI